MTGSLCYLDASACVKLVSPEPETAALIRFLRDHPHQVSSVAVDVELHRAAHRLGPVASQGAQRLLANLSLVPLNVEVRLLARTIGPPSLRTLDAIHLASAAALGDDLGVFVAYDRRLLDAAVDAGLPVAAPV